MHLKIFQQIMNKEDVRSIGSLVMLFALAVCVLSLGGTPSVLEHAPVLASETISAPPIPAVSVPLVEVKSKEKSIPIMPTPIAVTPQAPTPSVVVPSVPVVLPVPLPRVEVPTVIPSQPLPAGIASSSLLSRLLYTFKDPGVVYAATSMDRSPSPYFWLSSGGRMEIVGGVGRTIQGALPPTDPSRIDYARVNSLDTDNGQYPQNTFRLVTKSTWGNAEQKISFRITHLNLTDTPNRGGYSGIFLFNRYINKDNLYYAGIRDDGLAVIKKKIGAVYHTLAYAQVFGRAGEYNTTTNPSLIPFNKWMGMKTQVVNTATGGADITLFLDTENNGVWKSVLKVTDNGTGGPAFTKSGSGGIRTDYKDVEFDNLDFRTI